MIEWGDWESKVFWLLVAVSLFNCRLPSRVGRVLFFFILSFFFF